jgi:hypothetical protein
MAQMKTGLQPILLRHFASLPASRLRIEGREKSLLSFSARVDCAGEGQ